MTENKNGPVQCLVLCLMVWVVFCVWVCFVLVLVLCIFFSSRHICNLYLVEFICSASSVFSSITFKDSFIGWYQQSV